MSRLFALFTPYLGGLRLAALALALLAFFIQGQRLHKLSLWQNDVLTALSNAADTVTPAGKSGVLKPHQAITQINIFGQFRRDVMMASARARMLDALANVRVAMISTAANRKADDDYIQKIAALDATARRLRADLMRAQSARDGNARLRRAADMPAARPASGAIAAAPGTDGLSDAGTCEALDIEERLEASRYATQLDALIVNVMALAAIDPNAVAQ